MTMRNTNISYDNWKDYKVDINTIKNYKFTGYTLLLYSINAQLDDQLGD